MAESLDYADLRPGMFVRCIYPEALGFKAPRYTVDAYRKEGARAWIWVREIPGEGLPIEWFGNA